MAWIFDTYSMNKGHSVLGVVTGKPLSVGGSLGREEATARGALYCIQALSTKQGRRLSEYSVAIQGFGNVGSNLARLLHRGGRDRRRRLRLGRRRLQPGRASTSRRRSRTSRSTARSPGSRTPRPITNEELLELAVRHPRACALEQVSPRTTPTA